MVSRIEASEIAYLFFALFLILYFLNVVWSESERKESGQREITFSTRLKKKERFVRVVTSTNVLDAAFLECLFCANSIPYTLYNYHFGRLLPGPFILFYNNITFQIFEKDYVKCMTILNDYYRKCKRRLNRRLDRKSRVRNLIECLVLGWFIPHNGYLGNTSCRFTPLKRNCAITNI